VQTLAPQASLPAGPVLASGAAAPGVAGHGKVQALFTSLLESLVAAGETPTINVTAAKGASAKGAALGTAETKAEIKADPKKDTPGRKEEAARTAFWLALASAAPRVPDTAKETGDPDATGAANSSEDGGTDEVALASEAEPDAALAPATDATPGLVLSKVAVPVATPSLAIAKPAVQPGDAPTTGSDIPAEGKAGQGGRDAAGSRFQQKSGMRAELDNSENSQEPPAAQSLAGKTAPGEEAMPDGVTPAPFASNGPVQAQADQADVVKPAQSPARAAEPGGRETKAGAPRERAEAPQRGEAPRKSNAAPVHRSITPATSITGMRQTLPAQKDSATEAAAPGITKTVANPTAKLTAPAKPRAEAAIPPAATEPDNQPSQPDYSQALTAGLRSQLAEAGSAPIPSTVQVPKNDKLVPPARGGRPSASAGVEAKSKPGGGLMQPAAASTTSAPADAHASNFAGSASSEEEITPVTPQASGNTLPVAPEPADSTAANNSSRPMEMAFGARLHPIETASDEPAETAVTSVPEAVAAPKTDSASEGSQTPERPHNAPAAPAKQQDSPHEAAHKPEVATAAAPEPAAAVRPETAPHAAPASDAKPREAVKDATPLAPTERPVAPEAPKPAAARDIKLELAGEGDRRVEVRVSERAGDMRVEVRTPDAELAGDLRGELPALATKLEQNGFRADTWHPGAAADRQRNFETTPGAASQNSERQPGQNGQREQRDPQQQPKPKVQEDQPASQKAGKDFAWLFSSIS
jgi:hypothetical protein